LHVDVQEYEMNFGRMMSATALGLGLAFSGSSVLAAQIPGTFTLNGAGAVDTGGGSWELHGTAGGNKSFFPTSPLKFGDIGNISMDFELLPSNTSSIGGGSPRLVFVVDNNFDTFQDSAPGFPTGRIILDFQYVDTIGFTTPVGPQSTGNLLGRDQAPGAGEFELVYGVPGTTLRYFDVINQIGPNGVAVKDYNIIRIFVADDTTGLDVAFSNLSIADGGPLFLPEPTSIVMLAAGAGLTLVRRRKA
jgi:hypothetical protein